MNEVGGSLEGCLIIRAEKKCEDLAKLFLSRPTFSGKARELSSHLVPSRWRTNSESIQFLRMPTLFPTPTPQQSARLFPPQLLNRIGSFYANLSCLSPRLGAF